MLQWLKKRSGRAVLALVFMLLVAGLAISFPPDLAFLFAIDLSAWVEAAVAVYVAAQVTRIRPLLTILSARLALRRRRSQRQRRSAGAARKERSNDEEDAPASASSRSFDFGDARSHLEVMTSEPFRRFFLHAGQIPARA